MFGGFFVPLPVGLHIAKPCHFCSALLICEAFCQQQLPHELKNLFRGPTGVLLPTPVQTVFFWLLEFGLSRDLANPLPRLVASPAAWRAQVLAVLLVAVRGFPHLLCRICLGCAHTQILPDLPGSVCHRSFAPCLVSLVTFHFFEDKLPNFTQSPVACSALPSHFVSIAGN